MIKLSRRAQRIGLLIGFVLFVTVGAISLRELGGMALDLRWQILLPLLLSIPFTTHLSIRRFQTLSSAVDVRADYRAAASVVVWGGIANLLPVPGALMVRLTYLAGKIGFRRSSFLSIASLFAWFLSTAIVASILCFAPFRELALLLIPLTALFAGLLGIFVYMGKARPAIILRLLVVQLVLTTIDIARLVLIALLLQTWLPAAVASLMALTGVAASAVGVFPAGMGLTETLAAVVSWSLELQFALGFAVTALNRICGWVGLLIFMPLVATQRNKITQPTP